MSYLPIGRSSWIVTSNRDEDPTRRSLRIERMEIAKTQVVFPKDTAGGTWIAVSGNKRMAVLLNGAFAAHERKSSYRLSRGVMLLEFFEYTNAYCFIEEFDFVGIEPFTMILKETEQLIELRWDGFEKYVKLLDMSSPWCWSSSTLYDDTVIKEREAYFLSRLSDFPSNLWCEELVWQIHHDKFPLPQSQALHMYRHDKLRTLCITQIVCDPELKVKHKDLISGKIY